MIQKDVDMGETKEIQPLIPMELTADEILYLQKHFKERKYPTLQKEDYLTPVQIKAIEMFAEGMSWRKICYELNISPATFKAWKSYKAFAEAVQSISESAIRSAKASMEVAMPRVVDKMIELAEEGNMTALKDLMDRIFGDVKSNAAAPGANQTQNNIQIKVNLAAHRESEV